MRCGEIALAGRCVRAARLAGDPDLLGLHNLAAPRRGQGVAEGRPTRPPRAQPTLCRFFGRVGWGSRYAAARFPPRPWQGCTRANGRALHASGSSRASSSAEAGCFASPDRDPDRLLLSVRWHSSQSILSSILQDQGDGLGEAVLRLILCAPLPIGTGHLRAVGDEPVAVTLDNRGELARHLASIECRDRGGSREVRTTTYVERAVPVDARSCPDTTDCQPAYTVPSATKQSGFFHGSST